MQFTPAAVFANLDEIAGWVDGADSHRWRRGVTIEWTLMVDAAPWQRWQAWRLRGALQRRVGPRIVVTVHRIAERLTEVARDPSTVVGSV